MPLALPQPDYSYVTLCRQTEEVRSHCFSTGAPASAIVWSNVHDYPGTCFSRQTVYGPVNVRVKPGGQGHFACMYRLFCLISTTYVYYMYAYLHIDICINQSDKTTASTVLRVYCCGLAANFYLFKSNWQRTTAAHFGDTVAHRQTNTHTQTYLRTHATDSTKKNKKWRWLWLASWQLELFSFVVWGHVSLMTHPSGTKWSEKGWIKYLCINYWC